MRYEKREIEELITKFNLKNLVPLALVTGGGYAFFTAFANDQKVFIKYGLGASDEYESAKILYNQNQENFVKPLGKSGNFVVFEFIKGDTLSQYLKSCKKEKNEQIILDLENIAKSLISANIAHNDISAHNIMITDGGRAKLIDLQHANILPSNELVARMSYLCKKNGFVDDMDALNVLLRRLGGKSEFIAQNIGIYRLPKGAKQRIQSSLCYELGATVAEYSKGILGYLKLPFVLWGIRNKHKALRKKAQKLPKKLPRLRYYGDYSQAMHCKEHIRYKLGAALIKCAKSWYKGGLIRFYFEAKKIENSIKG